MRIGNRVGDGDDVRQERQPLIERIATGDHLAQRASTDELHRVEELAARQAAHVVDGNNRGMLQARGDLHFAMKSLVDGPAAQAQLLDGHLPVEAAIVRGKDAPEAAFGNLGAQLVTLHRLVARGRGGGARRRAAVAAADRRVGIVRLRHS
jgi:hypothetical protein